MVDPDPASLTTKALNGPPEAQALSSVAPEPSPPTSPNFDKAMEAMKLNDQEQFLYQTHLKNLSGGGVSNPAGGTSTLFAATFDVDGRVYVIPTVWNGQILPPQQAMALARKMGLARFPNYESQDEAMARYNQMHGFMEMDTTGAGH